MPCDNDSISNLLPRVALTGSIATGKSTVSQLLKKRGAFIIDADVIAREILRPGTRCWQELLKVLDRSFFDEEGNLKRAELKKAIAQDTFLRKTINSITHPAIIDEMIEKWKNHITLNPSQIVIFDVPLLFEANLESLFSLIVVVYVPARVQLDRLMKRDGLTVDEASELVSMQLSIEDKKQRAHWVIDNSSTLENTEQQVDILWNFLKELWRRKLSKSSEEFPRQHS